jgi:hypothetical protein
MPSPVKTMRHLYCRSKLAKKIRLGMHVRIVRTLPVPSALPDTRAKPPRFNIAACPYPPPDMLGVALRPFVLAP